MDRVFTADQKYLSHLKSKNKYETWMSCLERREIKLGGTIHILDITSSGEIHQWHVDIHQWHVDIQTRELSQELRETDLIDGTRLIIFGPNDRSYVQDHAGVMYDVDPGFFRAVRMNCDGYGRYNGVDHRVPEFLAGGRPQYLDLGCGWAGVIIDRNDNCNIVLVCAPKYPGELDDVGMAAFMPSLFQNIHDGFPDHDTYLRLVDFSGKYLKALLKRDKHFFAEAHKDLLLLLLPVLDIHAIYLYEGLIDADKRFRLGRTRRQENPDLVEKAWGALRMMRHDGMGPLDCIRQYDSDHNHHKVQRSKEYKDLAKRLKCIGKQISLTEALARDYMQHHVGLFSLDESRASIKQSKVALEESRRTKLGK
ncbi:hypothetical protein F4779DRAFT_618019 [Xylariaceae sp. FL0662B]|nr:hypothetical protein F4779DRAFT_618019 [Xylariaceae sp. FL0662B]